MLDWNLFGAKAGGHHLVNLFLHAGAVVLLFLFLNKTTHNIWPSAFVAAFIALHPLRVESVAWASERKDVLSMFFGMATLYAYAFYAERSNLSHYVICLLLFMLALMSKPMMVTLPFVFLLLDYWPLKRWQKPFSGASEKRFPLAGKIIWEKIPFMGLITLTSFVTFLAQKKVGTVTATDSLSFITRSGNAVVSYMTYLVQFIFPVDLAVYYPYNFFPSIWKVSVSLLILICISASVLSAIKKIPFLFTGWFWYLGTLIPVIGLVQVGSQSIADRYTYLPSIGLCIMLAWGIPLFFQRENVRKIFLFPAAISTLVLLAFLSWHQCGYWKDSISIFSHTLHVTNNNALAHNHLGLAFFEKNKNEEALEHFNKSIIIQPFQDSAYNNRGVVYLRYGMHKEAHHDLSKALSINHSYTKAYNNRANIYSQKGHHKMALDDLNKAIALDPYYIFAYYNRGLLFARLENYQPAINDFTTAIRLKNDYADAYNARAAVYLNTGNIESGCKDARTACARGNCYTLQTATDKGLCR
jgi:Flp pilus assembly protein TadD